MVIPTVEEWLRRHRRSQYELDGDSYVIFEYCGRIMDTTGSVTEDNPDCLVLANKDWMIPKSKILYLQEV